MQMLGVRLKPASANLYPLEIYRKNTHNGDYERTIVHEIKRECEEVERSVDFLIGIYMQHGRFVVRWKSPEKEIR
jgi:hypothetical protein